MKNRLHIADKFTPATLTTVLGLLVLLGCSSKPQSHPPTSEEQKKIEQDYQKTMEQQKQLTSGYDKSMQYTPPSTGYVPNRQNAAQRQQRRPKQQSAQQQAIQQSSQQPPPQSQPKQ